MCYCGSEHFYIFEPVELESRTLAIPVYFLTISDVVYAKCVLPKIKWLTPSHCEISIAPDLLFSHPDLFDTGIEEFKTGYPQIQRNNYLLSKSCCNKLFEVSEVSEKTPSTTTVTRLPNDWRRKAHGKIIRHVPITLYSNDTSGNLSKKWNKHISFYFSLSGLLFNLTNQQFNIHFLSTSNRAGVLEIGEQIVDELNEISLNGFEAYDTSISQPVLVNGLMLLFLGDSPMDAEITNTPIPGNCLNPCRMCSLSAPQKKLKPTSGYLQRFLHLDSNGYHMPNQPRQWIETIENTYKLWNLSYGIKRVYNVMQKAWGVVDSINQRFMAARKDKEGKKGFDKLLEEDSTRIFNPWLKLEGFDGCQDTPVEILHVVLLGVFKYMVGEYINNFDKKRREELSGRVQLFNTDLLNLPPASPKTLINYVGSLSGKDYKFFIQAAPFVFFKFMDPDQRELWLSLSILCSLIFQTNISQMDEYQVELKKHVDIFLRNLIKSNAQWINKPKFHMLLHLPESILCFGPASLFSTKKFKSFNSVLRKSSIHSNKQGPGKDIATSFSDYEALRFILCGSVFYNTKTGSISHSSPELLSIFSDNASIKQSMGYNDFIINSLISYPYKKNVLLPESKEVEVPKSLQTGYEGQKIEQVCKIQLNPHEVLQKGSFVLVFMISSRTES
ncbi:hypothetical protein PTTG_26146 [Puccinia triticina 1-1 BBBD Race 1]|uniref:Uncharacterized protein n=1 Tax=Puccinia triticina (isolate 1-1 / race 1 (BBBD)) TaxID=630390 RepID=A0A180GWI6_PUCT1|nr:hypothetical protein PTTG_26146 [Puccinia triticina 1-1 BBBD Race 1]